jgi:tetratricopeptide (TPR) repeat protein
MMAVPQLLPAAPSGFVGRAAQVDALTRWLSGPLSRRGKAAVAAVVGTAGVGKTALALHWAWRVRGQFPDGQLYLDLRGYDPGPPVTPEHALDELVRALGVPHEKIPAGADALSALYQSLLDQRRVLIVLDNASTADQVSALLPTAPGCVAVVTSRDRLSSLTASGSVQPLTVGLLSPAESIALLRQNAGAARVDAEADAAAEIARLCAHLPLALRVAAQRVTSRPDARLAGLAEELADEHARLRLLDAEDQANGLAAAFSWSYRALPSAAARGFGLLGLHAGPDISIPAAAALTGRTPTQARELLAALAEAHLLEEAARDRFRLHDLLRVYAAERAAELPERERAGAVERVLSWYLHTAETAVRVFSPMRLRVPLDPPAPGVVGAPIAFTGPAPALGWCTAERANLIAATRQAEQSGHYVTAWKLPAVLWDFFTLHGHWSDWLDSHEVGLAAARQVGDKHGEAWLENNLGSAYRGMGRFEEAIGHFQRSLDISAEIGNRPGEGWARYNIGDTYRETGRFGEALDHLRRSLVISRELGERWGEGYTLNMIGDTYRSLGQLDEALQHLLPALVTNREIGHRRGEGFSLNMIADTYQARGDLDQAVNYYQQALAIRREIGDRRGEGATLHGLGETHQKRWQFELAISYYQQSLAVRREIGDQRGAAQTLSDLARVRQRTGRPDAARESWRQALDLFDDLGDPQAAQTRAHLLALDQALDSGVEPH